MRILFVVTTTVTASDISPFVRAQGESLRKLGVELDYFIIAGKGWRKYVSSIRKLHVYLHKKRYDLIHAHYSYSGMVALCQKHVPVVVSFMGSDIFMDYEPVRQCLNGLIARLVVKRAGAIICKSNGMRRKIKRQAGVYVVPNGIDLELFRPLDQQQCRKKVGWSDARKYIVFVGDPIIPEKKYSLALESIAHLNNAEAEFRVIKDLPQEALPQYYNAADVLLMTSDYEGSPNVIKEALACNLPIVSTDVGDVAERLAGVRQCYVATGTKDDLAAKIADVLHNGGRSNGREHVLDLDLSSIARRLLVLYTDVLGSV